MLECLFQLEVYTSFNIVKMKKNKIKKLRGSPIVLYIIGRRFWVHFFSSENEYLLIMKILWTFLWGGGGKGGGKGRSATKLDYILR